MNPARLVFLGSGSAFTGAGNWQSNMLLESPGGRRLLIDCGGDIRFSLAEQGLGPRDIDAVYVSHLHADHVGGLEWLAFTNHFGPTRRRPVLFAAPEIADALWNHCLRGGMELNGEGRADLSTYFQVETSASGFEWDGTPFRLVPVRHVAGGGACMPAYGLRFPLNGRQVLLTTDACFQPDALAGHLETADLVFHDCETAPHPSGVHAHYRELVTLPLALKRRMWLYHHQGGALPDARADGFLGFVAKGQVFA
ncbi:MAG: MBL fold metallo-hydrolase [Caenispirillum sp.]|nr:MBL fold metallo-hydrolase [Caenispirillum sp.]